MQIERLDATTFAIHGAEVVVKSNGMWTYFTRRFEVHNVGARLGSKLMPVAGEDLRLNGVVSVKYGECITVEEV